MEVTIKIKLSIKLSCVLCVCTWTIFTATHNRLGVCKCRKINRDWWNSVWLELSARSKGQRAREPKVCAVYIGSGGNNVVSCSKFKTRCLLSIYIHLGYSRWYFTALYTHNTYINACTCDALVRGMTFAIQMIHFYYHFNSKGKIPKYFWSVLYSRIFSFEVYYYFFN